MSDIAPEPIRGCRPDRSGGVPGTHRHDVQPSAAKPTVPLRLADVIDGRSDQRFQRFSLIFHGPPSPVLPQGMYSFRHDAMGEMMLFIVPVLDSNDERIVYEACFSRLRQDPATS